LLKYLHQDQSFPAGFVKGFADIAAIARRCGVGSVTALVENPAAHGLVACEIFPVVASLVTKPISPERTHMTRAFALLFAAVTLLAGAGQAGAQGLFDMRDIMGGGPNFSMGGSSPIRRQTVNFSGQFAPGTIYINTAERRLYLVLANGQALQYGIGVGRDGFRWSGTHRITAKKEWPSWTPPAQMLRRRPDLPRHMVGGVDNPLGARAMYLGSTLYRIHGSNEPETIGQAVSSGCFRMTNEDVTDLYSRVSVGTPVVVKN
jgi:L,D-transpeptidase-like protein